MKFEYVVCKNIDGAMKVFIPSYKDFTADSLLYGSMPLEDAEKVRNEYGGRIIKMMVEDAKGLPCFVKASLYPDGIID